MKSDELPKKTRMIGARITEDLYEEILRLAAENTRTLSHQAEHMLKVALELLRETRGIDNLQAIQEKMRESRTRGGKGGAK